MPEIVRVSDFEQGYFKIPNAVSGVPGEGLGGDLDGIIEKYEKDVLLRALGITQYDELQTALGDLDNADQKWQDLVRGSGKWEGLKALIMPYVFCMDLRFKEVRLSTVGSGKGKAKAHTVADNNQRYVEAWNEFVDRYCGEVDSQTSLHDFLSDTDGLDVSEFDYFVRHENQFGF